MKYCSRCGAELKDDAVICPKCGLESKIVNRDNSKKPLTKDDKIAKTYGILSIIFGALGGILGLLFGICCFTYDKNRRYRVLGTIGIILFSLWVISFIVFGF